MERADEAGENRRANVSVHLAMRDEVYRYSLLLARRYILCKRRGKSRRLETVALRVAACSVTVHAAIRWALRDSLPMKIWESSEVRQTGRAVMPGHRTLCIGVGYPGIPVRPACQSASTSLLRRITGELQRDHRGAIVPMAMDSVVLVSNSRTWWPVSSNETAVLTS